MKIDYDKLSDEFGHIVALIKIKEVDERTAFQEDPVFTNQPVNTSHKWLILEIIPIVVTKHVSFFIFVFNNLHLNNLSKYCVKNTITSMVL